MIQGEGEHCLLLALLCGRDDNDMMVQTNAIKNSLPSYLLQKQTAGIINVQVPQTSTSSLPTPSPRAKHLSHVAPDLLSSAVRMHLMIVVATMRLAYTHSMTCMFAPIAFLAQHDDYTWFILLHTMPAH